MRKMLSMKHPGGAGDGGNLLVVKEDFAD